MLIDPERSLLVVSNMQEHMMPICDGDPTFMWNCCWLTSLAGKLQIPMLLMEHKRLGETIPELRAVAGNHSSAEIVTFSFTSNSVSRAAIDAFGRDHLIFCGNETHISVLQSAIDAEKHGFKSFVVGEACAARDRVDHEAGIARLRNNRIEIVTREMVLFEWIRSSEDERYIETSIEFLKHPHSFPRPEP